MNFTLTGAPGEDKARWMESQTQVSPQCGVTNELSPRSQTQLSCSSRSEGQPRK